MNFLLDTHVFLWFINDDPRLSDQRKDMIENEHNLRYLSVASLWEMSIKYNLGKLKLEPSYDDFVEKEVQESSIILLNIELEHLRMNASLPFHHREPFDRILIAQSLAENLPIMTVDSIFNQYPVRLV